MSWWAWFNAAKEANTVDPTLWMKLRDRGLMPVVEEFVRTLSRNIPFVGPYLYPVFDVATHMAAGRRLVAHREDVPEVRDPDRG